MSQQALFLLALVTLFVIIVSTVAVYALKAGRRRTATWDGLLARLQPVDSHNLQCMADDLRADPEVSGVFIEPEDIWELIGGMDGLTRLEHNSDVLIELAAYVQRWHPEALLVAEDLRHSGRQIRWHVDRLKGAAQTGNLETSFPDYAQRAAAVYFGMTQKLLALCEANDVPGLMKLRGVL